MKLLVTVILVMAFIPAFIFTLEKFRSFAGPKNHDSAANESSQMTDELEDKIDAYLEATEFSGSLLIVKDGKPIILKTRGLSDHRQQIYNNIDTKFNLGSMNKIFTAIAIVQLAQEHKLDFTDPVTKYLTDYPNSEFDQVTIHHLLTHTGGTGDIFGPAFEKNIEKLINPADYISLYGDRPLEFQPGTKWVYSNYGYVLLGAVIERISGQSYYDYIQGQIYDVAEMHSSDSYGKNDDIENLAVGYSWRNENALEDNYEFLPMRGSPAGGGYSSVEDLFKFAVSLQSNELLNPEFTQILMGGKVEIQANKRYAYGLYDEVRNGMRRVGHSGGAPGINSTLRIYPDSGYIVIVLGNFSPPAVDQCADYIESQIAAFVSEEFIWHSNSL